MPKITSFVVIHRSSGHSTIIITRNASESRAKRLWKKFLKNNVTLSGTYAVGYSKKKFTVKSIIPGN